MAATLGTTHSSRRHPQDIKGLKDALQTAIQLEFSTIPLYLCAAWSIMDTANPDRHTILGIVKDEMLHMGLACNMLSAIGGTPDICSSKAAEIVTVAPITHTAPQDINVAIEIPSKVKQHLGLDGERSWVILDDFNQFQWPGYDLRTIPKTLGEYAYGFLPPVLYAQITQRIITLHKDSLKPTPRD